MADAPRSTWKPVRRGLTSVLPDIMVPSRLVVARTPAADAQRQDRSPGACRHQKLFLVPAAISASSASSNARASASHARFVFLVPVRALRPVRDSAASGDIESVSGIWRDVLRLAVGQDSTTIFRSRRSLTARGAGARPCAGERLGRHRFRSPISSASPTVHLRRAISKADHHRFGSAAARSRPRTRGCLAVRRDNAGLQMHSARQPCE